MLIAKPRRARRSQATHPIKMPKRNLSDAIFEVKDKQRASKPASRSKDNKLQNPSLIKGRAFDTFYLFGFALLVLAIIVQIVALVTYS